MGISTRTRHSDEVLTEERRNVLPTQLYFRDDKEFVLLQAADLLMGDAR